LSDLILLGSVLLQNEGHESFFLQTRHLAFLISVWNVEASDFLGSLSGYGHNSFDEAMA
jgi:hypothetical protein